MPVPIYAREVPQGQNIAANSMPVVLATDGAALTVAISAYPATVIAESSALITAVASTSTKTGTDQSNTKNKGALLVLNVSAISGVAATVTLSAQGKDPISGNYYTLFAGTAITATGTTMYQIYPGSTAAASAFNGPLPAAWRVVATQAGTSNVISYTVSATLIGL
jgi:hypothetical protein